MIFRKYMRKIAFVLLLCLSILELSSVATVLAAEKSVDKVELKAKEDKLELDTVPEIIGRETATDRNHIERLYDKEEESLYSVVFENADGTETLYMFDYPVKYVSETGEIRDIKLDIERDRSKPGAYISAEHGIRTSFSKDLSDGINLKDEEVSITLQPSEEMYSSMGLDASTANLVDNKTVEYQLDDKTSLEYSLTYTGFKEDIVVSEYTGQTEYEFTLLTEGLTLTQIEGSYYLTDENGEIKANIGDVIIFTADERNNTFGSMTHETIRENEEYRITIHVDADYLRDEATAYPIRIDPTIEINYDNNGENGIQDVTINSTGGSSGTSGSLFVGKRATYGISRTLMRFPELSILTIPSASCITNATVEIRDIMCEADTLTVYCYVYTGGSWTESSASWSSVYPNSYSTLLSSNTISYANGVSKTTKHRYSFDITDAVKGWKIGNYKQSNGIIFKASSSVENGTTNISKTFASYNRSSNKPSLTVTYNSTNPQSIVDNYYYVNNLQYGKYLKDGSSSVSSESGRVETIGLSIKWKLQEVLGGYVIQAVSDTSRYLAVPMVSGSNTVEIFTFDNASIPPWCKWEIVSSGNGGYLLKNIHNSMYLYSGGTALSMVSSVGTSSSTTYNACVWRLATVSEMSEKQLSKKAGFNALELEIGETGTASINKNPSNALWVEYSDFSYRCQTASRISISSSGIFTGRAEGVTLVIATHKVTRQEYLFAVVVGEAPQYSIRNYVDQGYRIRFGGTTGIATYNSVIKDRLERLFGINLATYIYNYTSVADSCKISQSGSVTNNNLAIDCPHTNKHLTWTALQAGLGSGTKVSSKVLWTGHILSGNPVSVSYRNACCVIITPYHTTIADQGYANKSAAQIRQKSINTFMHEIGHQLGLIDHYCTIEDGQDKCNQENCDKCVYNMKEVRACIMSCNVDVEGIEDVNLFCEDCMKTIVEHLEEHH